MKVDDSLEEEYESIPDDVRTEWQKKILACTDTRLLEYVRSLCSARIDMGRAEAQLDFKPSKDMKHPPYDAPKKLKPLPFPTASDNMDENS